MNPRFLKEWRMLRTETVAGVSAAMAPLLLLLLVAGPVRVVPEELAALLRTVAQLVFCVVVCFLAAGSFGAEFQHRTIGLLLAQPGARARIWREKTMCLWTMAAILGAAWLAQNALLVWFLRGHAAAAQAGPDLPDFVLANGDLLNAAIGFAAVVAATPFFALSTRSTLVGAFLGLTTPFLPLAVWMAFWAVALAINGEGGLEVGILGQARTVFRLGTPAISAWCCWLGWRQFRSLELQDLSPAAGASLEWPRKWGRGLGAFLVCRPHGMLGNLIRKELCLLRPLAVITAVFTLGWIAARLAAPLMPSGGALGILGGLAGTFIPLTVLLAGAIPFGEEKQLGVAEWQLTLPVRVGTQWAVKLLVGACAAAVLGLALPLGLACLTLPEVVFHPATPGPHRLLPVAVLCGCLFMTSFWAATLLRNTIQAVLGGLLGLMAALFCMLGAQSVATAGGAGPSTFLPDISPWVGMAVVLVLLLMKSRRRSPATPPSSRVSLRNAVTLLAGFALPLGLACLTPPDGALGPATPEPHGLTLVLLVYWALFLASFWVATIVRSTSQGVLAGLLGVAAAFACILAAEYLAAAGWGGPVHLPPPISLMAGGAVVSIVLLIQSRRRFTTTQPSIRAFVLNAVILLATLFVVSFCAFAMPLQQDRLLR